MASDTPGTHLGEEGSCLSLAAGPVCSSGQGSRVVCLTQVILQQAEIAGDGQQQSWQTLAARQRDLWLTGWGGKWQ